MSEKTFYEETMQMMRDKLSEPGRLNISKMCRETGLGSRWVHLLLEDKIGGPSVHKVQKIHDYISNME